MNHPKKGQILKGLALPPDQSTHFVTNGGMNAVAVISLGRDLAPGTPTGAYDQAERHLAV